THDADDRNPIARTAAKALADGVFIGKVALRQSLVNQGYRRSYLVVMAVKCSPPFETGLHHPKIVRADGGQRYGLVTAKNWRRMPFEIYNHHDRDIGEGQMVGGTNRFHTRETGKPLQELLKEEGLRSTPGISRLREIDREG